MRNRDVSRRGVLLGGMGAAAGVVVAACGAGGGGGSALAPKPGTLKTDVTVPFLQTSGAAEQELVNQVVERWRQANPNGPKAEFVISTGDVLEKFTGMVAAGGAPALASLSPTQGVPFVDRGEMVALDDYAKRDKYDIADYIPASLDQYRWKGKLYGLLRDFSHQALWINTDHFAQAGITPPTGDYSSTSGGWDYAKFADAAARMTKRDGSGRASAYGFFINTTMAGGWGQFVFANGGEVFDKDFKKSTFTDERVVEGLQVMQDLLYRQRAAPDAAAIAEMRSGGAAAPTSQTMFFENQVAMAYLPVARIGEARRLAKGQWDIAVAPNGKGKKATSGGGVGWYQVKSFPHQEEAWALMQHLTSAQTHTFLADVRIPGRKSALDAWLAQSPSDRPKGRSVVKTGQEALHIAPIFPLWDRIEREAVNPQLARLWENKAPAREVAKEIGTLADQILASAPR